METKNMVTPQELVKARHPQDMSHIKLSYITHFYCNQQSIDSVLSLLSHYQSYPSDLLDAIEFVIVDDGSPISYQLPDFNLNLTWLRIDKDIQWNQAGARNLGVTYAKSDKIVMTDLDHQFPEQTLRYMVDAHNPGRNFYKVYRQEPGSNHIYKGHSNLFFMSRARFMRHHGYDEEYAGNYGAEDYRFVKYHKYHGSRQKYLPKKYLCFERDLDRNKAYHSLNRDLSANTPVDERKKQEIALFGAEYGHSRMFLNFTWTIVASHKRQPGVPALKTWWRPLWWFRYLCGYLAR
jgi:glycosyltransferase involved in cell wall biosynthesis